MKNDYSFAILILTYGRAGDVDTVRTLKQAGYTGDIFLVVDDSDNDMEKYIDIYGEEMVLVFNKAEMVGEVDRGDNFDRRDIVLFARNKVFSLARELNLDYFLVLDDDYSRFGYRFKEDFSYYDRTEKIKDFDGVIHKVLKLLERSGADTITFAQGGDFIGGCESGLAKRPKIKRKAMNSFFCKTEREFSFMGSINEDVNAYVRLQQIGKFMFMVNIISLDQSSTQSKKGGLTGIYLDKGTYIKSFYTILYAPSCVKLSLMGNKFLRVHHKVDWRYAVPKIIREEYKK